MQQLCISNDSHQSEVGNDPGDNELGTESLIAERHDKVSYVYIDFEFGLIEAMFHLLIFLLGLGIAMLHLGSNLLGQIQTRFFILSVQILLLGRNSDFNRVFASVILLGLDDAKINSNRVVTLGTPTDIVGVTECIHVQDVDETGCHEDVLDETGKHVPWIKHHETGNKVEHVGRHD